MKKNIYLSILVVIIAFVGFQELGFRRFLFSHHVFLAGCLPNFTAALLLIFIYQVIKSPLNNQQALRSVILVVISLCLYEIAQIWMPGRTFDPADVAASAAGGVLALLIILIINKRFA